MFLYSLLARARFEKTPVSVHGIGVGFVKGVGRGIVGRIIILARTLFVDRLALLLGNGILLESPFDVVDDRIRFEFAIQFGAQFWETHRQHVESTEHPGRESHRLRLLLPQGT